jgi:hypothetical protein
VTAGLPEETFRIRPWRDSHLWFLVHVAETEAKMRAATRKFVGECHRKQMAASIACIPSDRKSKRLRGLIGVLFFARPLLGGALVAHELCHAAFRVCDHRRMRVKHWEPAGYTLATQPERAKASNEEKYCHYVEHLTRDFWTEAYARRLA